MDVQDCRFSSVIADLSAPSDSANAHRWMGLYAGLAAQWLHGLGRRKQLSQRAPDVDFISGDAFELDRTR